MCALYAGEESGGTIDVLINKLWGAIDRPERRKILTTDDISFILDWSQRIIAHQPVLLELVPPLVICGDIHGQFFDLLRIFEKCGDPSETNYLFLGDYVDRGKYSVNTICLLLLYKIKYPKNFFLLRGNHETVFVNKQYGFYDEVKEFYPASLWHKFNKTFDWLPISAIIDNRILCIHGGISPELKNLNQLRSIKRPTTVGESGLVCDLLWSDPDTECECYTESDRGVSCFFGQQPLQRILDKLGLDLLVRAHQAIIKGFDFPFTPSKNAVTVFSAPNYCGNYNNNGAVMTVSCQMVCKFVIFESKEANKPVSQIRKPFSSLLA
ncbi:Serine/threonine-protein phosphatase PP1-alpha catalytic subunit [Tritrichomonas foetus]|uniref:Serine/threonine-protein phosphatase n=1 Tax=Tritrichomonas foetus TaxID=1144522 RepID=A0A1J4K9K7_9EUKA|nr:Serine/threonine-protein phosphatase PP1-alpha catalytic subunit [Tritrichomonas foetus]|eukprot:OHT08111.1 Serine/threonine-protein phosphatase PP1-alpha catalytic subunit [Tritrichomonas foetus]